MARRHETTAPVAAPHASRLQQQVVRRVVGRPGAEHHRLPLGADEHEPVGLEHAA